MPRASGVPLGPPASELKTLKTYLSADFNYLEIYYVLFI
jgi:hypothetical protein